MTESAIVLDQPVDATRDATVNDHREPGERDADRDVSIAAGDCGAAQDDHPAAETRDATAAGDDPSCERDQGAQGSDSDDGINSIEHASSLRDVEKFLRARGLTRAEGRAVVAAIKRVTSIPKAEDELAATITKFAALLKR